MFTILGMAVLGVNSWPTLFAFAVVTILLPPISEEAFYRKAIIPPLLFVIG